MNIAKNMEAIFLAALVIAGATSFATAAVPERGRCQSRYRRHASGTRNGQTPERCEKAAI
jgi:hypothetical protein